MTVLSTMAVYCIIQLSILNLLGLYKRVWLSLYTAFLVTGLFGCTAPPGILQYGMHPNRRTLQAHYRLSTSYSQPNPVVHAAGVQEKQETSGKISRFTTQPAIQQAVESRLDGLDTHNAPTSLLRCLSHDLHTPIQYPAEPCYSSLSTNTTPTSLLECYPKGGYDTHKSPCFHHLKQEGSPPTPHNSVVSSTVFYPSIVSEVSVKLQSSKTLPKSPPTELSEDRGLRTQLIPQVQRALDEQCPQQALHYLSSAFFDTLSPKIQAQLYALAGAAYSQLDDANAARRVYQKAIQQYSMAEYMPGVLEGHLALSALAWKARHYDQAAQHLETIFDWYYLHKRAEALRSIYTAYQDLIYNQNPSSSVSPTLLHIAIRRGQDQILRCLLVHFPKLQTFDTLKQRDAAGDTVLHLAKRPGVVHTLLKYPQRLRDLCELLTLRDAQGCTPLHRAHQGRRPEVVAALVQYHAPWLPTYNDGSTPLHHLTDASLAQYLITQAHADVLQPDQQGKTPLHTARTAEMVDVLLNAAARTDLPYAGPTALSNRPLTEALQQTFEQPEVEPPCKATYLHRTDANGNTPLHTAKNTAVLQRLLAHGANCTCNNQDNRTPYAHHRQQKTRLTQVFWQAGYPLLHSFEEHQHPPHDVDFSPDSSQLASASNAGGKVRLWDMATSQRLHDLQLPLFSRARVRFAPTKPVLAVGGDDSPKKGLALWNMTQHTHNTVYHHDLTSVGNLRWSPCSKLLAISPRSSNPFSVFLWDVARFTPLHQLESDKRPVSSVSFSPNGKLIASSNIRGPVAYNRCPNETDFDISIWDVHNGQREFRLRGHECNVSQVTFLSDTLLLSGSIGRSVKFWDLRTQHMLHELWLPDHTCFMAADPNGKWVVASNTQNPTIQLCNANTGEAIGQLACDRGSLGTELVFSTHSRLLTAANNTGVISVWELPAKVANA